MAMGWVLPILRPGQICSSMRLNGGNCYKVDGKINKIYVYEKKNDPRGLSTPATGLLT